MDWFSSNKNQKEFIEHLFSVRMINSLSLDINNFIYGKYSLESTRSDAVIFPQNIHGKILHKLSYFKREIVKVKPFELLDLFGNIENELSKISMDYNIEFKTLSMYDLCMNELKNQLSENDINSFASKNKRGSKTLLKSFLSKYSN